MSNYGYRPLKASDLEVGMVYYECASGVNIQGTVVTPVEETTIYELGRERKQWRWKAKRMDGTLFDCLVTEGLEHYGPRIYREPQYSRWDQGLQEPVFEVI